MWRTFINATSNLSRLNGSIFRQCRWGIGFHGRLRFSHSVTDLEADDPRLRRTDGRFFNPSSSQVIFIDEGNNTYLLVFNMTGALTGSSEYRIRFPRNRVNFVNGLGPDGSIDSDLFTIDVSISPIATITFDETEGVAGEPLTGITEFNQPVSGLGVAHFTAVNGTIGAFRAISSTRYEVEVTPDSGSGTLSLTLATDAVNEGNAEASATLDYRSAAPPPLTDAVLVMSVSPASVTAGGVATVTFRYNKLVGGFTDSDVDVSTGATKGTLRDEGNNVWRMPITAPSSGSGTVRVSVGSDVVSPGNNADSVEFFYTAPPPEPPPPEPKPEPPTITPTLPNDPTDVKVELTPTTALILWKAPNNGAVLRGYEISYAEGASLGSTWIPTGSTSTRFLVKNLKRGTQHTFAVRGINDEGNGPASSPLTEYTPIASLHNTLFFKECVNYLDRGARVSVYGNPSELVRPVADNDYNTFTREKDLNINIAVNGQPTRVDAILVKGIDIEGHSAEPTGGSGSGYSDRRMPTTVKNWEGSEVSTVVAGFQHDLYLLSPHFTATSVRLTFTGANAKIHEIMLLEFGIEIDANADFTEINPDYVDRTGVIHPDTGEGIYRSPTLADARDKWEVDLIVKVVPGKTLLESVDDFLWWRSQHKNHVFALEPSRHPGRIHPASFLLKRVPVRLRTDNKLDGEVMNLRIGEQ